MGIPALRPVLTPASPSLANGTEHQVISNMKSELSKVLFGKQDLVEKSLVALLGGGHLLLQGPPGTGKTSLAKGLAQLLGGAFRRVQMTSDLLPSDILGTLRPGSTTSHQMGDLQFRPGPIFSNVLLADELNRTSPKTQSALLEAMAEGTVSVDGKTYPLPDPFFVVATQNPLEFHGVYPLAESELDRFMLELHFSVPEAADELAIYQSRSESWGDPHLSAVTNVEQIIKMKSQVSQVQIEQSVLSYIHKIVQETRTLPSVSYGVSIRGALQWIRAIQALAYIRARNFVLPGDVIDLAPSALAHRLCFGDQTLSSEQRISMIGDLLEKVKAPK